MRQMVERIKKAYRYSENLVRAVHGAVHGIPMEPRVPPPTASTSRVLGLKFHCPFHDEKTPSFFVSELGNYYCFACKAAGTAESLRFKKP